MFPLGAVTFPGATLSLHVFEDRYRELLTHLLSLPEDERVFGTVAIRDGHEVGANSFRAAHRVGCEVLLTDVTESDESTFSVTASVRQRIRVDAVVESTSFMWGEVEQLAERAGDGADDAAARAHAIFRAYLERLESMGVSLTDDDLPTDPLPMSYALSARTLLTLRDRQDLLEAPDAATRLRQVSRLLVAEMTAIRAIPSLPATDINRTGWSPN